MTQSQMLLDVSTNALLLVEFKKLEKPLTKSESNNLLLKYLKRIAKIERYRKIRKSVKHWILLGRQADANLENILDIEHDRLLNNSSTDLYRFVVLIEEIESELKTKVQYSSAHKIDLSARFGQVLVCVVDENLKASFDDDGLMCKSTQILFIGSPEYKDVFSSVIDKAYYFQSVVAYEDESHLRVELFRR
ncbi:hypothetical protein ABT56_17450 [Photobacterium aquae]|uniref:DUF2913 domain-containing protein n=1 Tax=Photobacterium aquae TaxID=1195763 RepID=A0A0J1GVN6_9GAMM|nr:DUF2913 family protein [Photobacterium aquae]KLV03763.1 hypothetical protein ABT56_17450 [Photobacterium aquae]